MHIAGGTRGNPKPEQIPALRGVLRELGYWYCATHHSVAGTASSRAAKFDGMITLRYSNCKKCAPHLTPPFHMVQTPMLDSASPLPGHRGPRTSEASAHESSTSSRAINQPPRCGGVLVDSQDPPSFLQANKTREVAPYSN